MTRPHIVRADTIDLQDHDAPSAKEHRHPTQQPLVQSGPLAPHQAETLREVAEERAEEETRSPRASWPSGDPDGLSFYADDLVASVADDLGAGMMQHEDALAIAQNGGMHAHHDHMEDDDDDLDDDDDMMDKVSSSPSIEDGWCTLPPSWPQRVDSLRASFFDPPHSPSGSALATEERSSSPYLDLPNHPPLQQEQVNQGQRSKAPVILSDCHLLPGEYAGASHCDHTDDDDFDEQRHSDRCKGQDHDRCTMAESTPLPPSPTPSETDECFDSGETVETDRGAAASVLPLFHRPDSGIGLRIEDFSLQRHPSFELDSSDSDSHETASPHDRLVPYEASEEDDDLSSIDDLRFIDSGWGGECLQETEDIDFEFVYALHTFVATVEGQANATKGDTMVLLDDSNSYWWLVRVVKDTSIGYLPAEHIETPTERLARLNKHRNIDLSATMLGDQSDKLSARNPLKAAMKRKKKTVAFAAPTYVDYSDNDFSSSDEEDTEVDPAEQQEAMQQQAQQADTEGLADDDESAKVEPLKPKAQKQSDAEVANGEEEQQESASQADGRDSEDTFDESRQERITKNGTVRNTDSFFKDDSIETKKMTLTPNLLRDDKNEPRGSSESLTKELRQRPSLEKELVADKPTKEDKKKKDKKEKEKEKKSGGIRSFFSRKDKKKSADDDDDSIGKRSMDTTGDAPDETQSAQLAEADAPSDKALSPQKNSSKLQKQQPRSEPSPTRKAPNNVANVPPASLRMVESEPAEPLEPLEPIETETSSSSPKDENLKSTITKILTPNSDKEPKPPKVTKAKSRVELDDFDSSQGEEEEDKGLSEPATTAAERQQQASEEKLLRPTLPGSFPDSYLETPMSQGSETSTTNTPRAGDHSLVSPLSPLGASNPPALMIDSSSQEDRSSPISSPSPELGDVDDRTHHKQDSMTTSTSATTTSTWNDSNLRAFFDSGTDIRDMLSVVYDKSDVPPAGPDHPVPRLFMGPNAKLAEITTQLDNMLGDWLARKQRLRGSV